MKHICFYLLLITSACRCADDSGRRVYYITDFTHVIVGGSVGASTKERLRPYVIAAGFGGVARIPNYLATKGEYATNWAIP